MCKKSFLIFLGCLLMLLEGAIAQEVAPAKQYLLKGQLLDAETSEGIPFAHVSNFTSRQTSTSDSSGYFTIPAMEGDSIQLSSITYGRQMIAAPAEPATGDRVVIRLLPDVYELDEVVVQQLPSEYLLKQRILSMELPKKKGPELGIPENYYPKADPSANAKIGLGSPVSSIAGMFSKKERGRAFAAEMKAQESRRAVIATKFNREIVRKIIRTEDEDQLDAFMKYCVLTDDFIFTASEYDIHKAVIGCYSEFVKEKG